MFKLLREIVYEDREKIGLKAYNCSLLLNLHVNAKPGFVIFEKFEPADMLMVDKHTSEEALYAVRSSMGDEDKTESSNAGKYESVMAVTKEELASEIERIMETETESENKAVLVQELVFSEAAGVVFTKHPVYKTNAMLINAGLGAGENVVSALANADSYEVEGRNITKNLAEKRAVLTYGFDSYPGEHLVLNGIEVRTVISNEYKTLHSIFYEESRKPVLTEEQIYKLYEMADYLRKEFGYELDVEFAVEKNKIYILQVRPITVLNQIERVELEEADVTNTVGIFRGQIVSKGTFRGSVINADLERESLWSNEFCKDKVLVVSELLPELLYCVDGVGAILTAKGGVLSHGAIMAREKGIPCISGLGELIYELKSGMILEVNADRGEIYIGE